MNRIEAKTLDKEIRVNNFDEVSLGFTKEEAIMEASRCLNCPNPRCVGACPVGINIPAFIEKIKNDNVDQAYQILLESNPLPRVCGRVCPQENQCEGACIRNRIDGALSIGNLERYASDFGTVDNENSIIKNDKKVLIVGSGPSGLTCAGVLAKNGYDVTIYEALHESGGVLRYGIPSFRLPKSIINSEIKRLEGLGIKIVNNVLVGKTINVSELKEKFDAIFIGTGAGTPKFMGIPGEDASGVYSANEILTRINLMNASTNDETPIIKDKKVFVIGGGNVALDAARSLKRLGNNVKIIYRRKIENMPARKVEIEHLLEEGIEILELTNPIAINKNEYNEVTSLELVNMAIVDEKLVEKPNTVHKEKCDAVVMALGTNINKIVLNDSEINNTSEGIIIVDSNYKTSLDKVYAGGDVVTGSATVIKACEAGKIAANQIMIELSK